MHHVVVHVFGRVVRGGNDNQLSLRYESQILGLSCGTNIR